MPIPKHSEWVALKKKYGVADGAAKGINLGKDIDAYWNSGADTPQKYKVALTNADEPAFVFRAYRGTERSR